MYIGFNFEITNGKTQKVSEIIVLLHSYSQRFFAYVSHKFSNSNKRRMTFAHVAILLPYTVILLPAHPASFAHTFVSGMQSFYFSESQDAIVLQTWH